MHRMPQIVAIAASVLLLAACAPLNVAQSQSAGYPAEYSFDDVFSGDPIAVWGTDRATFDVVAFSSSTCTYIPTAIGTVDTTQLSLSFVEPGGDCTSDRDATTYTFETPDGVDAGDVTIKISLDGENVIIPVTDQ
jgi:hypothetical protein